MELEILEKKYKTWDQYSAEINGYVNELDDLEKELLGLKINIDKLHRKLSKKKFI